MRLKTISGFRIPVKIYSVSVMIEGGRGHLLKNTPWGRNTHTFEEKLLQQDGHF